MTMDAIVQIDSRVFMLQRALRKYIDNSALTELVKPDGMGSITC